MEKNSGKYLIIKPSIARQLVKMGYKIIDLPIYQSNGVKDFTKCIFMFQYEEGLDAVVEQLKFKNK